MKNNGIIELLALYQHQRMSKADFEQALQEHIQICVHKQAELELHHIPPQDRKFWEQELKPALKSSYLVLIRSAQAALDYASSRDEKQVPGIIALVQEISRMVIFLENRANLVGLETQRILTQSMALKADSLFLEAALQRQVQPVSALDE